MKLYDPKRPPSGAIPRFPLWEVIVAIFTIYYGIVGLSRLNGSYEGAYEQLLGGYSIVWFIALLASGILTLTGLAIPAPNGFVIHVVGMAILSLVSTVAIVGLSIQTESFFFPGSTLLIILSVGGILRLHQLMMQLIRLGRRVNKLQSGENL